MLAEAAVEKVRWPYMRVPFVQCGGGINPAADAIWSSVSLAPLSHLWLLFVTLVSGLERAVSSNTV